MPRNRFPDSAEKRELRRRDGRLLRHYQEQIGRRLDYCGMPSVEFLDVEAWLPCIRSVVAVEYDPNVLEDVKIERDARHYPFPVQVIGSDILDFLLYTHEAFDLYNLDFYGGFINPRKNQGSRSVDAIRCMFSIQAKHRRSFVLITTFNVRERGAQEYLEFLDAAKEELAGRQNSHLNIQAHAAGQVPRLKLCFPFFCWQQAHATGFEQHCENIYTYRTSATMVHFHQSFVFRRAGLPTVPALRVLIDLANMPLFEMKGQIPYKKMVPEQIL